MYMNQSGPSPPAVKEVILEVACKLDKNAQRDEICLKRRVQLVSLIQRQYSTPAI
jgi:hypothetical protein